MIVMKKDNKGRQITLSLTEQMKLDYNRRAWFLRRKYKNLTRDLFNVWEHNRRSLNNQSTRILTLARRVGTN
jgi:hypothetical protein